MRRVRLDRSEPQGDAGGAGAGSAGRPEGPAGRADRAGLDLRPRFRTATPRPPRLGRPSHAPIPAGEFEQTELLAIEKESIGIFISAHPLKKLSVAMRTRTDCTLGAIGDCRDGDRVTVGGIISQAKRLRTKKGDPMMFATLDDLEGSVELVIFGDTLQECADAIRAGRGRTRQGEGRPQGCDHDVRGRAVGRALRTIGRGARQGGARSRQGCRRRPPRRCGFAWTPPSCRRPRSLSSETCWRTFPGSRRWSSSSPPAGAPGSCGSVPATGFSAGAACSPSSRRCSVRRS